MTNEQVTTGLFYYYALSRVSRSCAFKRKLTISELRDLHKLGSQELDLYVNTFLERYNVDVDFFASEEEFVETFSEVVNVCIKQSIREHITVAKADCGPRTVNEVTVINIREERLIKEFVSMLLDVGQEESLILAALGKSKLSDNVVSSLFNHM